MTGSICVVRGKQAALDSRIGELRASNLFRACTRIGEVCLTNQAGLCEPDGLFQSAPRGLLFGRCSRRRSSSFAASARSSARWGTRCISRRRSSSFAVAVLAARRGPSLLSVGRLGGLVVARLSLVDALDGKARRVLDVFGQTMLGSKTLGGDGSEQRIVV